MSTSATPALAAAAGETPGTGATDIDLDDVFPETNFSSDVVQQLGDPVRSAKVESQTIEDGEVVPPGKATAPKGKPEAVAEDDDDDSVGEPGQIDAKGRVRGPDGKFARKAAADEAAADVSGPKKVPEPFRYRTQGQTQAFDGSLVDPETGDITIKAERASVVREALNALHVRNVEHIPTIQKITARNQELEAELAQQRERGSVKEAQAEKILASLDAALDEPDEQKALEKFFELREKRPQMKLDAEREYWKRIALGNKATAPAKPAAAADEAQASTTDGLPTAEEALAGVTDYLETLKIQHEYRDITAEDWQQFEAGTKRRPLGYIVPATEAHVKAHGVRLKQPVFDTDALYEDIQQYVSGLREQRAVATRREELAVDRSRRTTPQVTTPPSVDAGPPAPKAKERGITSKDELDRWFDSPEL